MKAHDGDWLCMPDPRAPLYLLSASPVRALGVLGMASSSCSAISYRKL